jgi:EpsI family protein
VFGLDAPAPLPPNASFKNRELPMQFWSVGAMLLAALGFSLSLDAREDIVPQRVKFLEFPMRIGNWSGSARTLERPIEEVVNAEDYVLADYKRPGEPAAVNFFAAFYGSAQKSRYRPTPDFVRYRGWEITASETKAIEGASVYAQPLRVNCLSIQKGSEKQLVYFWFQQREHNLTTVSSVKWYGIWDGVTRNRTDGALVRIVTDISGAEEVEQADQRLADFIRVLAPELEKHVPR